MSLEAMALVLHHSQARGTAKLVLLGIANHQGDGGSWPSLATLARYGNCQIRQVQYILRELERRGELKCQIQVGGTHLTASSERPNLYHVLLTCPPDCDRTMNHRSVDNRVHSSAPGAAGFTGGVQPSAPPRVQPSAPEPSVEPPLELLASVRAQLQDARARGRRTP